ncbi:ATP-binding cassette domain-containing protein [Luteolibacter sp. SL250]|uniref:ATP-binding cassette domain-containing protein n=1 Tax=Luteolibacter sp. SL250 TaxID=2995170 RepID=UPI0022715898|nr:ATP-binding cassette domain-containing protein [Luteolibacter sp. SL250]WAC21730.1 ATP-binding cassette domain-containing protein [Luteolibacter sp. SL250]
MPPSSAITARAASASFEDPVLQSVYLHLAWLAAGEGETLEAFCRYTEERIGMFLPAARAALVSEVMLRRAEIPASVEPPAATEHQIYLTVNLVEAAATLPSHLSGPMSEKIASLGWTRPWLEKVAAFVGGVSTGSDGILSFSSNPARDGHTALRGLPGGTLRMLESGGHWFVRHDCPEPLVFSGLRWPARHSQWLKESDHILIGGEERLDLSAVTALAAAKFFPDLHVVPDAGGLAVSFSAESALARLSWDNGWFLTPHDTVLVNGRSITGAVPVLPADQLVIGGRKIPAARLIRCASHGERGGWSLHLDHATLRFPDGQSGLDDITLALESGDLVAVMGPSGCGKSTLMSVLSGGLSLTSGKVGILPASVRPSFALVPQDDVLFAELTVTENLRYAAALRTTEAAPDISGTLAAVGLEAKGALRVGSVTEKVLSGGERKRLNIGLELIGRPDALLLDEPTSGLSSADAEGVMKILRTRADAGVLVMAVIHQPSPEVFARFDKVIVLDVGGRLAFFGTPEATRDYFGIHAAGAVRQNWGPDGILDSLVGRRTTLDGGAQRRNFDPAFWKLRYAGARHAYEPPLIRREDSAAAPETASAGKPWAGVTALTLLRRESLRRIRGWRSVAASCVIAVVLAAIVAWVCRIITGEGNYSFTANRHLPAFCFLNVILVQFLALSSSVQELVKDRAHRLRERLLKIPGTFWLLAKLPGLALQSALQAALVVWTGAWIIGLPYGKMELWLALTLAGWTSVALGLFVSALPGISERVALAAVPLMLVPQMILCGAAPFDFRDLSHLHWPNARPVIPDDEAAPPPWPAQAMPSRWAYQAAICGLRDHPSIITKEELKPLFKTYNFARSLVDVWKTDPAAFLGRLEEKTGRRLTEAEVRTDIARLVLNDKRSAKEVADTFGPLVPDTSFLKPIRNEFFLEYATSTFPAVTSLLGKEVKPAEEARWNMGRLGIVLLLAASLVIQISPRALLSLIRRRKP